MFILPENANTSHFQWVKEEEDGGFPLEQNRIIDVSVFNEEDGFHIYLNGQHFANFKHYSSDKNDIGFLQVEGDIDLHKLSIHPYHVKPALGTASLSVANTTVVTGPIVKA